MNENIDVGKGVLDHHVTANTYDCFSWRVYWGNNNALTNMGCHLEIKKFSPSHPYEVGLKISHAYHTHKFSSIHLEKIMF